MAAYAALLSLMHTIQQIGHHPCPPISLDKQQVESLTEKLTFLQEFLEAYSLHVGDSNEADPMEMRIADAAYAAEDIIESHIVDQILSRSTSHDRKIIGFFNFFQGPWKAISFVDLYQGLERVIQDMDFTKRELTEIKEKMGVQDRLHRNSAIPAGSSRCASAVHNSTMVGFDDILYKMMDKLTGGLSERQIIPIVGMGGLGKTTLARNIYENQVVVQHFDIRAWATISQEYGIKEILLKLVQENAKYLSHMNEYELGEKLYRSLCGRRYLIIMDDVWDIEVWDQLKFFFPDNSNGSRIMLTTRLANLGIQLTNCPSLEMNFLDEDTSWDLLRKNVFGKEDCPAELEAIGKKIAKNCKGLPLSIVVVGGLLAKSEKTREYWEYIVENLNSIVSLEDDERCLKILHTSYKQLPAHLKPCFLYLGIFPEDSVIRVSKLIELWVAEGFLKPIGGKSLEEIAEVYFEELIERNLILVEKCNSYGKLKSFKVHDLTRDLCLREARKQKFLCVLRGQSLNIPQGINRERCVCMHQSRRELQNFPQILQALKSASHTRSLHLMRYFEKPPSPFCFRLLRLYSMIDGYIDGEAKTLEAIFRNVNLRYIAAGASYRFRRFPSSFSLLWNLQTLIITGHSGLQMAPSEIWMLPQLRHVKFPRLELPDPPSGNTNYIVLENLQTLLVIKYFKCGAEVVRRIPNIKKLKISYAKFRIKQLGCLKNLENLHKLECLGLYCGLDERISSRLLHNLTFPRSLKKLVLVGTHLHWEELTTKIGSLPLLQVLKLKHDSVIGTEWHTAEGGFCSLKFLLIEACDLKYWMTDSTHFPRLEHLLINLKMLREIPSSIADTPTLQSLQLGEYCSLSAVVSAKMIQREQEELENVDLKVQTYAF